jgi:hypothetical protein
VFEASGQVGKWLVLLLLCSQRTACSAWLNGSIASPPHCMYNHHSHCVPYVCPSLFTPPSR